MFLFLYLFPFVLCSKTFKSPLAVSIFKHSGVALLSKKQIFQGRSTDVCLAIIIHKVNREAQNRTPRWRKYKDTFGD